MNLDLFMPEPCQNLLPYDGHVEDYGLICTPIESNKSFDYLLKHLNWKNDQAYIHGKHYVTGRKYAWYADQTADYIYSGFKHSAEVWDSFLLRVKQRVETVLNTSFNSCLANLYMDGSQGMGWHSDADRFLGSHSIIASLSFGVTRKFKFKHRFTGEYVDINLYSGQLIVMKGKTQQFWLHSLPKMNSILSPRINLTFRNFQY